ncbi:MAG: response regulator transcription factor [Flavobacteriales bacterium]|nr:response regulator transcription factor [Flavobacteriales bacterium]
MSSPSPPATMPPECRIALVDDHAVLRTALANMVNTSVPGYRVVVEAGHGREFIDVLERGTKVDMVVLDLEMPVMNGYDTLAWITKHRPDLRVLVLSFDATPSSYDRSMRAGAHGFLLKNMEHTEFKTALDAIRDKGIYRSERAREELQGIPAPDDLDRERAALLKKLTKREREFLELISGPGELTYKQVAEHMGLSPHTVEEYRKNLFTKFAVQSKTGLVQLAIRWRLGEKE